MQDPAHAAETEGSCPQDGQAVSKKWTVKNPGKVPVPTSDDYGTWTVAQLRKECSERKLGVSRVKLREEHIERLNLNDAAQRSVDIIFDSENELPQEKRRSKHCCVPLLNILFSDKFAVRFARSEDTATRAEIDIGAVHLHSPFWKEVTEEFLYNTSDYNDLETTDDPRFSHITPSKICQHDSAKLYGFWNEVNRKYVKALGLFTRSGHHNPNFADFIRPSLDLNVLYLRACLQRKPALTDFVSGGMLEQDKVDTLKRPARALENKGKLDEAQAEITKCVARLTDYLVRKESQAKGPTHQIAEAALTVDVIIDRIAKLHQLIDQVKASIGRLEAAGRSDEGLELSLAMYERPFTSTSSSSTPRIKSRHLS